MDERAENSSKAILGVVRSVARREIIATFDMILQSHDGL